MHFWNFIKFAIILSGFAFAVYAQQGEDAFFAGTTAHKMRLTVRAHELMNNPKFFEAIPEYKELEKYKEEVVRLVMEHDSSKLYLSRDSDVIKTAVKMYGTNWRGLSDTNPMKDKARLAFAELTRIDTLHEGQSAQKLFPGNSKVQQLAQEFMRMIDYDDVPKMRHIEFGAKKGDRPLKLSSEWIQEPEIRSKLKKDEFQRLLKLGKVLESKEFDYSKTIKYYTYQVATNKKYEDLLTPFLKAKYPDSHIALLEKNLVSEVSFSNKTAYYKSLKAVPVVVAGAIQTYQYVKNPDRNIPENFLKGLVFLSTEKPYCRAEACHLLQIKCGREQHVQASEVDWKKCSQYFYSLSLDQQDIYLKDKSLKDYFQDQAPLISDITCSNSKAKKQIDIVLKYRSALDYSYSQQNQKIILRDDGSFSNAYIPTEQNTFINVGFDNQNVPVSIQDCKSPASCSSLNLDSVKKYGIISPQAKRWLSFSTLQQKNISNCCSSSSCVSYFENRNRRGLESQASSMAIMSIK